MAPLLNSIELLTLLAVARRSDDAYGVTIAQEIEECTGRAVSLAAVYAALDRLLAQSLLKPWLSEPRAERGGRRRRHYALTPEGCAFLRRERANALKMWGGVSPGLRLVRGLARPVASGRR